MHDMILYFKQYQVRRNCHELKSTFYVNRIENSYESTIKKFQEDREMYFDDEIEQLDDDIETRG